MSEANTSDNDTAAIAPSQVYCEAEANNCNQPARFCPEVARSRSENPFVHGVFNVFKRNLTCIFARLTICFQIPRISCKGHLSET
jgi:hypothetical protein